MPLSCLAPVEPLEDRIAPAILFLNPATLEVLKADGSAADVDASDAAKAGATLAIKMAAGDSLVLDIDGNRTVDDLLVSVSGGNALVFITDRNGNTDFDADELTGLAVSDGFKATIYTDVNGSIATVLGPDGKLVATESGISPNLTQTLSLQPNSIDSLTITGKVTGNIFAGDSLSNVRISGYVSGNLATGDGIGGNDPHLKAEPFSFNGSTTLSFGSFTNPTGKAGGSISNVILNQGAHNLITGSGGSSGTGVGGAGGSITNVSITIANHDTVWLKTGSGGNSSTSTAGSGGSVSGVTIKYTTGAPALSNLQIETGGGGKAIATGNGGRGGSISDVTLSTNGDLTDRSIVFSTGPGGAASTQGTGGHAGSITNVSVQVGGSGSIKSVVFAAGNGGSTGNGYGGTGGSLEGILLNLGLNATGNVDLIAGDGGNGVGKTPVRGGKGGSILDATVITYGDIGIPQLPATIVGSLRLIAGDGGALTGNSTGTGGVGGSIVDANLQILGSTKAVRNVVILAGSGGDSTLGAGGAGGSFTDSSIRLEALVGASSANLSTSFSITAGAGGAGKTVGGAGGTLKTTSISFLNNISLWKEGPVTGTPPNTTPGLPVLKGFTIQSGAGGALNSSATAKSVAGAGGAITGLQIVQYENIDSGLTILAADGGAADDASTGRAGKGGSISSTAFTSFTGANTDLILVAGGGGASASGKGDGAAGGSISKTSFTALGAFHSLTVQGGVGSDAGSSGRGGVGGAISGLHVATREVTGAVKIIAGAAGEASGMPGAAGGAILDTIVINHGLVSGGVQVTAGAGGSANDSGAGGAGGAITRVLVANNGGLGAQTAPAPNTPTPPSLAISSGAGGQAGSTGAGGAGGTISALTLSSVGNLPSGTINGGAGGEGGSSSGAGGAGGKITGLSLNLVDTASLIAKSGAGGESQSSSRGGAGGAIDGVAGQIDAASFRAGAGGESANGTGGAGGNARNFAFDTVGRFVRVIAAGDGGKGITAGAGGSVSNVVIPGDIGDFTQAFDVLSDVGQGGLVTGHRGEGGGKATNGSITSVTATRIASILAGTPANNAINYDNGVYKITKLAVSVLGADVDGDTNFDWIDAPNGIPGSYQPDKDNRPVDGDTAIDGLVVVRKGGFPGPHVDPHKFIEV